MVEEILRDLNLELEDDPTYNPHRDPIIEYKELEDFNKIIKKVDLPLGDPERLVCRCEQVSEKTIRDAMNRGIPCLSFDSIKRRTRAGMGFCQGSFCRSRVIEVMEDELGEKVKSDRFDSEHSGITRVNKTDINEFIKTLKEEEKI